mgnify:CR=1 FL=1
MIKKKIIFWFRNDLRLHDQDMLKSLSGQGYSIIPFYCFDDRFFSETDIGFPRTGAFRLKFLLESLYTLKQQLEDLGTGLIIRKGNTAEELLKIHHQTGAKEIYAAREFAWEEKMIEQEIQKTPQLNLSLHEANGLFKESELPFDVDDLPDIFTQFRKKVEKKLNTINRIDSVNAFQPLPSNLEVAGEITFADFGLAEPDEDNRAAISFTGGEDAGLRRLNEYIWESGNILTYKKTRNGLLGKDYSTKFSAWLADGSLSPKKVIAEVNRFEEEHKSNVSTYWVKFELLWREYFRWIARKYGARIFFRYGIKNERKNLRKDFSAFERWRLAKTNDDFVNANMQELLQTGYMSNRGRQNVASFLIKDLSVDWRWGATWFESQLIDYDVYSNWGNWMYVAGVGNDPRENRYFNTQKQAERYDADGRYRKIWLKR